MNMAIGRKTIWTDVMDCEGSRSSGPVNAKGDEVGIFRTKMSGRSGS